MEIRGKKYIYNTKDSYPKEMFKEWRAVFEEHYVVKRVLRMQM